MERVFFYIVLALVFSSCTENQEEAIYPDETTSLTALVNNVGAQMGLLGFAVATDKIAVQVKSKAEMMAMFQEISDESRQEVKEYKAFGPSFESELNDAGSRLAFYDPNSKTIVLQAGALHKISKGYLAHELAHVYQDQKWGLENIWRFYRAKPSRELFNITQYLIEGHAELARQAYEQKQAINSRTVSGLSLNLGKVFDAECVFCDTNQSTANLPYSVGLRFLLHQYRSGGWDGVENFFNRLPSSSEQIIHPDKLKIDSPKTLKLPEWHDEDQPTQLIVDGTMGEAYLLTKLLSLGVEKSEAFTCASGWDGDIAHIYRTEKGEEVFAWRIIFDRQVDAEQLTETLHKINLSRQNMRNGRVVDWIMSDNAILEAKVRIFMSKHPQFSEQVWSDGQSVKSLKLSETEGQSVFFSGRR